MADSRAKVLEMVDEGMIDKDTLIQDLLNWLSTDDVVRFCHHNEHPLSMDDLQCDEDD